jgi:hypothetical protein
MKKINDQEVYVQGLSQKKKKKKKKKKRNITL